MLLSVSSSSPLSFCPLTHLLNFTFSDALSGSTRYVVPPFRLTPTSAKVTAPNLNRPCTHVFLSWSGSERSAIAAGSSSNSKLGTLSGS